MRSEKYASIWESKFHGDIEMVLYWRGVAQIKWNLSVRKRIYPHIHIFYQPNEDERYSQFTQFR